MPAPPTGDCASPCRQEQRGGTRHTHSTWDLLGPPVMRWRSTGSLHGGSVTDRVTQVKERLGREGRGVAAEVPAGGSPSDRHAVSCLSTSVPLASAPRPCQRLRWGRGVERSVLQVNSLCVNLRRSQDLKFNLNT